MSAAGLPVKMVALEPAHALMVLCAELDPTTMVQLDVGVELVLDTDIRCPGAGAQVIRCDPRHCRTSLRPRGRPRYHRRPARPDLHRFWPVSGVPGTPVPPDATPNRR